MKRLLYSFVVLLCTSINSFAQQWVIDDIAEERKTSEPITLFDIICLIIIIGVIWCGYKFYKYLKSIDKDKYTIIRNDFIVGCIIISVLLPFSIYTYYDIKNDRLEKKAIESMNYLVNNANSYIEVTQNEYPSYTEIEPRDNKTPSNKIDNNFAYRTYLEMGATPYKGIYRCFNINTYGHQVIFAKEAKNKKFSTDDDPVLYHGWIKPYRIRYYSPNNIYPDRDLRNVYRHFLQDFVFEHQAQNRDNITYDFFYRPLNEYYEISHKPGGDEMWYNNDIYYESDHSQERTYEYKTINYGNFDITYCIARPCKIGVCEKKVSDKIFGSKIFDDIHIVKRYKTLAKFGTIWGVIIIALGIIFILGRPTSVKE